MQPYPLTFRPIFRPKVWGGRRLERFNKSLPDNVKIGESWELADLPRDIPNGRSVITNGQLTGQTLAEAIDAHRDSILGSASLDESGCFPLLIKLLDACDNLSVQVHPSQRYAAAHPSARLKSEAWYVLEAADDAVLYKGIKPGTTQAAFEQHLEVGRVIDVLQTYSARVGDFHYLPSGTVHALGCGIVVAEIQTTSDTTFRLYDWNRTDRKMHIEQALACLDFESDLNDERHQPDQQSIEANGFRTWQLCQNQHFSIEKIESVAGNELPIVTNRSPEVWMVLAGSGSVADVSDSADDANSVNFAAGTTLLMPAGLESFVAMFAENATLLRVTLPSPLRGMIA